MDKKHLCPCSSSATLLRHISHNRIYWFCSRCHQEMPDLVNILDTRLTEQNNLATQALREVAIQERTRVIIPKKLPQPIALV
ncbi:hypothetical protein [Lyngbya aestuarii]|uniref:hypothetical protein n=1 Tax=Lyngbya aestuarii TaxID=118322 RepID=UPI00403DEAAE